jgi:hypothetical protein
LTLRSSPNLGQALLIDAVLLLQALVPQSKMSSKMQLMPIIISTKDIILKPMFSTPSTILVAVTRVREIILMKVRKVISLGDQMAIIHQDKFRLSN